MTIAVVGVFVFFTYPQIKLNRVMRDTESVIVFIQKDSSKWPEFQRGAFEMSGGGSKKFLSDILESSTQDHTRFASRLELYVYPMDEKRCLARFLFRNGVGYRFDFKEKPDDLDNPMRKFVENAQRGKRLTDKEFEKLRPTLLGIESQTDFKIGL